MHTTELITPPAAPDRAALRRDAGHNAPPCASKQPTFGAMVAEAAPLIGAIAGYGPPVIALAGPWLLFVLMLSGPFAFLVILVAFMLVAATVVAALVAAVLAIPAAPFLLVRRLRARHAFGSDRAAHFVPVQSPQVAA